MTLNRPGETYDTAFHTSSSEWEKKWFIKALFAAAFAFFAVGFVLFVIAFPVLALIAIVLSVTAGSFWSWLFFLSQDQDFSDGSA